MMSFLPKNSAVDERTLDERIVKVLPIETSNSDSAQARRDIVEQKCLLLIELSHKKLQKIVSERR